MEFKKMIYLATIYKHNNLTTAAEELFLTPQALSKQIKQIETELNELILIRNGNRISFTDFGKFLVDECNIMISQYNTFEHHIENYKRFAKTIIHIDGVSNASMFLGYNFFDSFKKEHPEYELILSEYNDYEVDKRIGEDLCDLALCINTPDHAELYDIYPIKKFELGFILSKNHPLANKEVLTIFDVEKYPILTKNENFKSYHYIEKRARKNSITLNYALKTPSDYAWISSLQDNKSLAVSVNYIGQNNDYVFKPLDVKIPFVINLVIKKEKINDSKIVTVTEYIHKNKKD